MTGDAAKLNNHTGTITAWNDERSKWKVKMEADGQSYLVKPSNLWANMPNSDSKIEVKNEIENDHETARPRPQKESDSDVH